MNDRGSANVVGVALLVGITVVSLSALTASVGIVIDTSAEAADADRVASDFEHALDPVAAGDSARGSVSFLEGRLDTVERELLVRADGEVVDRIRTDALVFERGDTTVAFDAGAIVRGDRNRAWFQRPPRVIADEGVLLVTVVRIAPDENRTGIGGRGDVTATLETDASYERRTLEGATVSISVETSAPAAWEGHFQEQGANVDRKPGDPEIVVATFEKPRTAHLVVYDLDLEVSGRG